MKSRNHRMRHWILRELDRVGDQRRSAACRGRPEPAPGRETGAESAPASIRAAPPAAWR